MDDRLPAIDFIKAAAIVAVVATHAGPAIWDPAVSPLDWKLRVSWTPFHVPAFLAVAGFLYARSRPVALGEITPRLRRIVVPYLVASAVAWLGGWWAPESLLEALRALLTSRTVAIYYFIGMLALCIAASWPISRLGPRAAFAGLGLLTAVGAASEAYGQARLLHWIAGLFTGVQLRSFASELVYPLVCFLGGWLAALHRAFLAAWLERAPWAVLALALAGIAGWLAAFPAPVTFLPLTFLARLVYTLCVITAITLVTRRARVPDAIRFLSEASLGIYLFHIFFALALEPRLAGLSPGERIPVSFAFALAGGVGVCLLARRLLGARARGWVGA